jgi:hypothetical protein
LWSCDGDVVLFINMAGSTAHAIGWGGRESSPQPRGLKGAKPIMACWDILLRVRGQARGPVAMPDAVALTRLQHFIGDCWHVGMLLGP